MENKVEKADRNESAMSLRRTIYFLEALNLRKKIPLNDSEMITRIIKEIKRIADEEVK